MLRKRRLEDSALTPDGIARIEELLVEFHDICARHRFDIGMNEEFKVKLTPRDDPPAYSQSLPAANNLKEDTLVKLAMLHKYDIITTLQFSEYASPKFAQKKPNRKLRLMVDMRKINNLISDDYINHNHPVSTLIDAAQHKTRLYIGLLTNIPLLANGAPALNRVVGL